MQMPSLRDWQMLWPFLRNSVILMHQYPKKLINLYRISTDATHREDLFAMAKWLNSQLKQVGVDTKLVDLGRHTMNGEDLPLPPAILGRVGNDSTKKTVLIYGHFDVQQVCF